MRDDLDYDTLIEAIYPDLAEYELEVVLFVLVFWFALQLYFKFNKVYNWLLCGCPFQENVFHEEEKALNKQVIKPMPVRFIFACICVDFCIFLFVFSFSSIILRVFIHLNLCLWPVIHA